MDQRICPVELIGYSVIFDMLLRPGNQLHRPLQSGIIEEIKIRFGHLFPVLQNLRCSTGNTGLAQFVIDLYHHLIKGIILNEIRHRRQKRQEPAFMSCRLHAVHINAGAVRRAAEADGNLLSLPLSGDEEIRLIPDISRIFPDLLIRVKILKARWDGNPLLSRHTVLPVFSFSLLFPVQ